MRGGGSWGRVPEEDVGRLNQSVCQLSPLLDQGLGAPGPPKTSGPVGGFLSFLGPRHQPRRVFSVELVARLLLGELSHTPMVSGSGGHTGVMRASRAVS